MQELHIQEELLSSVPPHTFCAISMRQLVCLLIDSSISKKRVNFFASPSAGWARTRTVLSFFPTNFRIFCSKLPGPQHRQGEHVWNIPRPQKTPGDFPTTRSIDFCPQHPACVFHPSPWGWKCWPWPDAADSRHGRPTRRGMLTSRVL